MADIKNWNLSEIGMIFDPETGESFQLNNSAHTIISLFKRGHSANEIAEVLVSKFGISFENALTDVMAFQIEIEVIKSSL